MTTTATKPKTKKTGKSSGKKKPARTRAKPEIGTDYVDHPSFSKKKTEQELWGPDCEKIPVPRYELLSPSGDWEIGKGGLKRANLTAEQERTLFLRYNYAKYRLAKLQRRRKTTSKTPAEIRKWRRRAERTREKIVHANLALVPAMAKRKNVAYVEFQEMLSEGYMAILRSVEHFDASRGYKFSTYACRAILACFHRLGEKTHRYRSHVSVRYDPEMERNDYLERRHDMQRDDAGESVRQVLRKNIAELTETEQEVIRNRFPMARTSRPKTLRQVGKKVGLSSERVRQIEAKSLDKLRDAVEGELAV